MGHERLYNLRAENLDDESRLRYRSEIRDALDSITIEKLHIAEFEEVIAAVHADSEAAAVEHSLTCEPAQAALKAADEKTLAAIRAKQPIPPEATNERVAALKIVADANAVLEGRIAANKATVAKMRGEIHKARMASTEEGPLQTALQNLASVDQQHQFAIIGDRLEWSRKRYTAARSLAEMNANLIESERNHQHPDQRHIATYRKRLEGHQRVADDAADQVRELDRELAQLRQQMLEE